MQLQLKERYARLCPRLCRLGPTHQSDLIGPLDCRFVVVVRVHVAALLVVVGPQNAIRAHSSRLIACRWASAGADVVNSSATIIEFMI